MKIEVRNLSFSYGEREILHDISFSVGEGEYLSILGSNGVGKSTLFKCMLGLLKGYSGEITIDGTNISEMSISQLSKCIAYIPQYTSPTFNYSVEDIVLMGTTAGSSPFRTPKAEEMKRVDAALEKTGISSMRNRCFHHLSGGERQLVIIARALAQNARILMLDEPTASLDFGNQMLVLRQSRALANEGYTIIQTTHNPEHSYLYSDRIVALKNGSILAAGTPDNVIREDIISRLYGLNVKISSLENDRMRVCLPAEL